MPSPISQKRRVLIIGLDGATFDIIQPMIAEGRLKNFSKFIERGSSGSLTSTILPLSSVAWSSFVSGKNPAKHGMYDFSKRTKGSYSYVPVTSLDRGAKALWQYVSEAGKRSLMINIPLTYPPEKLNGIMISGFPYPENRQDYVWPKETLEELRSEFGSEGVRILKPNPQFLQEGDELRIFNEVSEITRRQTEITKYLIKKELWDLVTTVYDSTDVIGHFFWHHLDPMHPKYNAEKAKIYGPLVYDVYEELDKAIGEIASLYSDNDLVFLISDHGFGPVYHAVYMNNWLIKNNYLRLKRNTGTRFRKTLFDVGITSEFLFNSVKKLRLVGTKTNTYSKKSKKVGLAKKLTLSTDDIDWNESLAYASGNYGPIYINLKGREPHGKVEKGEQYELLVDEISSKLRKIENPETGKPLVDIIYTKENIYSGPYYDDAPDIIYFDSTWLYYPLRVFEFGSKKLLAPNPIYTGAHRMEGIFIARGEEITHKTSLSMNLIDVAPTVLRILGIPVPQSMDGRVLTEIFEPTSPFAIQQHEQVEPVAREQEELSRNRESRSFESIARKVVKSSNLKI